MTLLDIRGLSVDIPTRSGLLSAVRDVDLRLEKGEALGIVGESGSGKSMTALSLVNLIPKFARRSANRMRLGEIDLANLPAARLSREVLGRRIGFIFQDPMSSLNPVYTIGRQLTEGMRLHFGASEAEARRRALELLERVRIPDAERRLASFPHEMSGGQRQRVMIAMALMNSPDLLIADEPTTALDVTVQAEILSLIDELRRDLDMGVLLISHDLGVVSRVTDRVAIMYAGEIVETGPSHQIFSAAQHPYTRALMDAIPGPEAAGSALRAIPGVVGAIYGRPSACVFERRCDYARAECHLSHPLLRPRGAGELRCVLDVAPEPRQASQQMLAAPLADAAPVLVARGLRRSYLSRAGLFARAHRVEAVKGVSLEIRRGETFAIVGESGCGKSTLARMLIGLDTPDSGEILLDGKPLADLSPLEKARRLQMIFQDPNGSLNPSRTVRSIIQRPLDLQGTLPKAERAARVSMLLDRIGLAPRLHDALPHQLSGGQRQRVAIARALAAETQLVVCDEPTSALDVSIQAQILNLLNELRAELGLSLLLISHDLNVVAHMADRIAVMHEGTFVEVGPARQVMTNAAHPYTKKLLQSARNTAVAA
ncbi:ABC transporter ATP-binding protein [Cereibacter changlensis]|uniref:ABC transporter ATP-binding protein n=1 Tax=Cereibacter changlensis TaxID=402884 RepID=A0A4U0Z0X2_9RHOB|nr:ABC transporter ATP-binding protein [Cereibacter changlensis]TKA96716.1 ABC transporter ATP-binding protein [Cereibacter changlensis]